MCAFDSHGGQSDRDMEKALDQFSNNGWKQKKAMLKAGSKSSASPNEDGQPSRTAKDGSSSRATGNSAKTPASHASPDDKPAWTVKPYVTKKGRKGVILRIGPLSAFIPEGDTDRKNAVVVAMNVIRTNAACEIANRIRSE